MTRMKRYLSFGLGHAIGGCLLTRATVALQIHECMCDTLRDAKLAHCRH